MYAGCHSYRDIILVCVLSLHWALNSNSFRNNYSSTHGRQWTLKKREWHFTASSIRKEQLRELIVTFWEEHWKTGQKGEGEWTCKAEPGFAPGTQGIVLGATRPLWGWYHNGFNTEDTQWSWYSTSKDLINYLETDMLKSYGHFFHQLRHIMPGSKYARWKGMNFFYIFF